MVKGSLHRGIQSSQNQKWFVPILLYVIASILIFYIGYSYYNNSKNQALEEASGQLEMLSSIKIAQITEWFDERDKDVSFYKNNKHFLDESFRFINSNGKNNSSLAGWLNQTQISHGYDVFIIDKTGKPYFIIGNDSSKLSDFVIDSCITSLKTGKSVFLDIYRRENTYQLFYATMATLKSPESLSAEACLVFRSNVQKHLIAKIINSDYKIKLISYSLVRNEGDSVFFVNADKYYHLSDLASGNIKRMDDSPFVLAAQNKEGIYKGIGLQNEEVLSSVHRIPNSKWFLVVHSNLDKILAPLNDRKWSIIGFGLLAVVVFIIYHLRYVLVTKNKRLEQVIELYKEINSLNQNLEQRVEERTKQVAELNLSLESRANQLELLNKELESFTYSVSHDLKAPLRAIQGFSDIIIKEHINSMDEELQRLFTIIHKNAKRMDQLIKDLLDLSKISRSSVNFRSLNMNAIITDIIANEYPELDNQKVKFKIDDLLPASGDFVLITQVWTNFISNAIKYSQKKNISIIEINSKPSGDFIEYHIRDNGAGFNQEYSAKLFTIFQRLHTKDEFEGTGIGLAIVKRIIEKHNGNIWAYGKENEGADFYFTLPKSF